MGGAYHISHPYEHVFKLIGVVDPLALEHSESCGGSNCLEGCLTKFQRNGHHFIDPFLIPFHELHRGQLLGFSAQHLIVERHRRNYPLGGILADALYGIENKLLHLIAAERLLPESIIPGHKVLRRRTDQSYRGNKIGSYGFIELIQIRQSENIIEGIEEHRSSPALIIAVHGGETLDTGVDKSVFREPYIVVAEGPFEKHHGSVVEIYRIALDDGLLHMGGHFIKICIAPGQFIIFEQHIIRRNTLEVDFPAFVIRGLTVEDLERSFITALAGAFEFSIPFIVHMRIHFVYSGNLTALRASQRSFKYRQGVDKDIAHSGQLLTSLDEEFQQLIVLLEELFSIFKKIIIYLIY